MDDEFRILSYKNDFPQHISRRNEGHSMQFHNLPVFQNTGRYIRFITADMKWLIFKRPDKLRSVMVRAPFLMKRLAQVLNCNRSSHLNQTILKTQVAAEEQTYGIFFCVSAQEQQSFHTPRFHIS